MNDKTLRGPAQWTPLACLGSALLMAVLLLPSVLRQSPPQQNQSAELSPDAKFCNECGQKV